MRSDGNDFRRGIGWQDLEERAEESFERKLVERLCGRYRVSMSMLTAKMDQLGLGTRPTLSGWCEVFPSWPIYLDFAKVKDVADDGTLTRLLRDFANRKVFREFVRVDEDRPANMQHLHCGVCLPWPHLARRNGPVEAMVLHTGYVDLDTPGARMIWTPPKELKGAEIVVMETFTRLLAAIDSTEPRGRWRPE